MRTMIPPQSGGIIDGYGATAGISQRYVEAKKVYSSLTVRLPCGGVTNSANRR